MSLSMSLRVNPDDLSVMDEYRTSKIGWILTYQSSGDVDKANRAVSRPIYPAPRPADIQTKIDYLREKHLNFFSP